MDIKFIQASRDSRAIAMYITEYITKNSLTTHNIVTIISAVHKKLGEATAHATTDDACNLVLRCLNKINVNHEISSPEAAQYLLDNPDHYCSETFANIYVGDLLHQMEKLVKQIDEEETEDFDLILIDGHLDVVSQRMDYTGRPDALDDINYYEFVAKYTKSPIPKKTPVEAKEKLKPSHVQFLTHRIKERKAPVVPSLLKLPPLERDDRDDFERMALLLFCPFRHVQDLLFDNSSNWKEAYLKAVELKKFSSFASSIMENLADIHGAMEQRQLDAELFEDNNEDDCHPGACQYMSQAEVQVDLNFWSNVKDLMDDADLGEEDGNVLFNRTVVTGANEAWSILDTVNQNFTVSCTPTVISQQDQYVSVTRLIGRQVDEVDILRWNAEIKKQEDQLLNPDEPPVPVQSIAPMSPSTGSPNRRQDPPQIIPLSQSSLEDNRDKIISDFTLNTNQALAFKLVADHVISFETQQSRPKPFRFLLLGEGGTGKTQVIFAMRQFFKNINRSHLLRVTATTGKAAALIKGSTIHKLIGYSRDEKNKEKNDNV
jgi:hypothetical protein